MMNTSTRRPIADGLTAVSLDRSSLASGWMGCMTAHDVAALLPDVLVLRTLCRSMAVLEAILSPDDWESRYHSFNAAGSLRTTTKFGWISMGFGTSMRFPR